MSETDSFIDEVSEEVRRDRLYGYLRRYGWIGALGVVVIVGGAAFNEYRKAQIRAEAEALGDNLLAALESDEAAERRSALDGVVAEGQAADIVALLSAAERVVDEDPGGAAELLRPLAQNPDAPAVYADLAALKLVLLGDAALEPTTRAQLLERLALPGAPYAALAREQQALMLAAEGRNEDALEAAQILFQEDGLTPSLRQRLAQFIIALGGELPLPGAG
ncbi:MAG: hypothetical protein AAGG09_09030 [Pseudomonadota bacterium]